MSMRQGEELRVQAVRVDKERVIELTRNLVGIPSVYCEQKETAVAEYLAAELEQLGLEVKREEVSAGRTNVLGVLAGVAATPHLILCGHMDVVPAGQGWDSDPYSGRVLDGRVYGRGAADMKGGLAAMVAALEAVIQGGFKLQGTVTLAALVDEEENQTGVKDLTAKGISADFAIVGEPTRLEIFNCAKGDYYFEIVVRGKSAHASTPELGRNAIAEMAEVIRRLGKLHRRLARKKHTLLGRPTLSVGTIDGGSSTSVVPDHCRVTVDRRLLPTETHEEARAEFQEVLDEMRREDPDFAATLETLVSCPPMETPADSEFIYRLRQVRKSVLGRDGGVRGASFACDGAYLVAERGIPTVILGPGDIADAHKPNESVAIDELVKAAEMYAAAIVELL